MGKAEKLIMACDDVTKVMSLDPKIETGNKSQMRLDLAEAAKLLQSSDMPKLKNETIAVLEKLGMELPKKESKKEKKEEKKESKKEKKELSPFGRRMNSIVGTIDTLTVKGATEKEIIDYVKKVFPGKSKEAIVGRMKGHFIQLKKEGFQVSYNEKEGIYKVKGKV